MAFGLEKAFGIKVGTLLRMLVIYDLVQLKPRGEEPDVRRLEEAG